MSGEIKKVVEKDQELKEEQLDQVSGGVDENSPEDGMLYGFIPQDK